MVPIWTAADLPCNFGAAVEAADLPLHQCKTTGHFWPRHFVLPRIVRSQTSGSGPSAHGSPHRQCAIQPCTVVSRMQQAALPNAVSSMAFTSCLGPSLMITRHVLRMQVGQRSLATLKRLLAAGPGVLCFHRALEAELLQMCFFFGSRASPRLGMNPSLSRNLSLLDVFSPQFCGLVRLSFGSSKLGIFKIVWLFMGPLNRLSLLPTHLLTYL